MGGKKLIQEADRKIDIDIERNRLRIQIFHGEDEEIIKLNLGEAEDLAEKLGKALGDYSRRKHVRID